MARRGGGFKSDKRRKELLRLQKQEEKRQRRFGAKAEGEIDTGVEDGVDLNTEGSGKEDSAMEDTAKNIE